MKFLSKARFIIFLAGFFCIGIVCVQAADPVVVELHYQNGVKFYKRGLYDRAIQEFEKTLSMDPGNKEAAEYLERVKSVKEGQTRVEAKKSDDKQIKSLYDEGKKRYQERDYKKAIEVFDEILAKKPVDDFASFYKERSEIFISRQLAREKKIEDKKILRERREKDKADKKSEEQLKKAEKKDILDKRSAINERRRSLKERKVMQALEAESAEQIDVSKLKKNKALVNEKAIAREEKMVRRLEAKNARLESLKKRKQEKREEALARKSEKSALEENKLLEKNVRKNKKLKVDQVEGTPIVMRNKEMFLKGVEHYGHKEYEAAIASFEAVVEAESSKGILYTNSAKRLIDKAKKKLQQDENKGE